MAYESGYSDSISMPAIHKTGKGAGERMLALYVEGKGNINEKVEYFSDISSYIITKKDLEVYLRLSYEEYHHRTRKYHNNIDYQALYKDNLRLIQSLDKNILQLHYVASTRNSDTQVYLNLANSEDLDLFQKYLWPILIPNQQSPNIKFTKFTLQKIRLFNSNYIYMKPEFKKEYSENELVEVLKRYLSEDSKSKDVTLHKFIVRMCNFIKDDDELIHICERLDLNEYKEDARRCFYVCKELIKEKVDLDLSELELPHEPSFPIKKISPIQQIFYGAPGTGKSNEIKLLTGNGTFSKNYTFRITFHPDSDYSSFVGAYKPIWNGEKIVYVFRPQSFLKAYIAAWKHPELNVALVIEEINRGNCAQIFGDIFQLLDRESTGFSKYPIEADIDMQTYIKAELDQIDDLYEDSEIRAIDKYYDAHYDAAFREIKNGTILSLPNNLSILATMNTSDQSLFPMDSAFKRRWEWQYMPIIEGLKENGEKLNWKIKLDNNYKNIDWWAFLQRINVVISDLTTSEDKQLGYFFCQPNDYVNPIHDPEAKPDLITAKYFVDKVIFYLWNDVFKDYAFDAKCCKDSDEKEVLFAKFYNEDGKSVNIKVLKHFFESLKTKTETSLVEEIISQVEIRDTEENRLDNNVGGELEQSNPSAADE